VTDTVALAGLTVDTRHFIGGQRVASAETFDNFSPIDGALLAKISKGGQREADLAVEAARKAFPEWSKMGPKKRGELLRSHGGASLPEKIRGDVPFNERQAIRREEKKAIARVAAGRIRPNETIFLDASSTVLTLTEFLPIDMPLTVITNALNVINALADRPNLDLICTGGLHVAKSQSFVGLAAEKSLLRYHIHRMFLSGDGLHLERGLSESNSRQASFKERVIASAEDVVFLADHSKLGRKASYFFGEVGDLSCLVSDEKADAGFVADLQAMGVEVLLGNLDGAPSS